MSNTYHFVTNWRVKARTEEVYDIISQPTEFPRWWPSVYLEAKEMVSGTLAGVGRRVQFHSRGWLPYTLHWEAVTADAVAPRRIVIEAAGDFNGRGVWTFVQDGLYTNITYEWDVTAEKAMIRYLSPAMHKAFEANHKWAMKQGEISLRQELIRYRARLPEDMLDAAEPRGPVELPVRWIAAGALAASAIACIAVARRKSRKAQPAGA